LPLDPLRDQAVADDSSPNYYDLILARRLTSAQRANPAYTAGLDLDLAHMDDDVARTLTATGTPTFYKPNAFGELLHRSLELTAPITPITDLQVFQQHLKDTGFLPPSFVADGSYTPGGQFSSASYDYGSFVGNEVRQGAGRPLATPTRNWIDLLGTNLPTHVVKGLGGLATGLLKSFGGTASRLFHALTFEPGAWGELGRHIGEDALNVLTVASLFSGVGEILSIGGAVAAEAGLESAGALARAGEVLTSSAAKDYGFTELGAWTTPTVERLAQAGIEPGWTARIGRYVATLGDNVGDSQTAYGRWVDKYIAGPKVAAPVLKAASDTAIEQAIAGGATAEQAAAAGTRAAQTAGSPPPVFAR
jgi:hypothetical protein